MQNSDFYFSFDSSACNICNAKCCSGDSGIVQFSKTEMIEIADFLSISTETFLKDFCKKEGYSYILKEIRSGENYNCIFLSGNKCDIYEVRPKQCRTFPFWDEFKNGKNLDYLKNECIGVK